MRQNTQTLAVALPAAEISKHVFTMQEALTEYREVINENTSEIQSNYEFLCEVDNKIEKLAERLDELFLMVGKSVTPKKFSVKQLTAKEKRVFLAAYSLIEESGMSTSYKALSVRLSMSQGQLASYLTSLMAKGIPVKKKFVSGNVLVSLDEDFRREQAQKNIIGLDTPLSHWF